ncbi:PREDICTED: transcription termination factor MTEF1, chloroplastic isoform X2 [Nelumbo nucifera]|uniref:Transcription termination factor MTEF1, chloroplastic isoform X2 n=1 Tax=Nelumbo nucifera TaxID=4432 RepID=A0A1U7Z0S3_NELNU|nr:PREDICTED: transcription termination factor MTEF1, chloroplastic isoform X2 [Nelumbo nucifera]
MEETLHFCYNNGVRTLLKPYFPSSHLHFPSISRVRPLSSSILSSKTSISLPKKPSKTSKFHPLTPHPQHDLPPEPHSEPQTDPNCQFREKMLYLESIGIDLFSLVDGYPPIVSSSLDNIKSTVDYMRSMGFTPIEFRRICGMCPEILSSRVTEIAPVFAFLLREVNVKASNLRRVINRRPRLLACDVEKRLRPTLYFLQRIGIEEVDKHTSLLSCSVEEKFIPRIECLERIGFSYRDAISMVRRFPQMFCYSIKDNLEPKFDYFVMEMGRDLKELKEFPQYFSFSLENRIKPRHRACVEKGVCFPLHVMLKTSEKQFRDKLENFLRWIPLKTFHRKP